MPDSPKQTTTGTASSASTSGGGASRRAGSSHPTYLAMVVDAVQSQQVNLLSSLLYRLCMCWIKGKGSKFHAGTSYICTLDRILGKTLPEKSK